MCICRFDDIILCLGILVSGPIFLHGVQWIELRADIDKLLICPDPEPLPLVLDLDEPFPLLLLLILLLLCLDQV